MEEEKVRMKIGIWLLRKFWIPLQTKAAIILGCKYLQGHPKIQPIIQFRIDTLKGLLE
jgi:hypothetical protein